MALPSSSIPNRALFDSRAGFTLIELLVVISLSVIFFSFTVIVGLDSYRSYGFRGERDSLVAALQIARSQALNNVCLGSSCSGGQPHGVHVQPSQYIIFQGSSFAGRDASLDQAVTSNYGIDFTGSTISEVVFSQLSAYVLTPGTITLKDQFNHQSDITINREGRISWTN